MASPLRRRWTLCAALLLGALSLAGAQSVEDYERAVDHYLRQLQDPDAQKRGDAVDGLTHFTIPPSRQDAVRAALTVAAQEDSDPYVRSFACTGLAHICTLSAGPALIVVLEQERNTEVRERAAGGLESVLQRRGGSRPDWLPSAVRALRGALDDPELDVAIRAGWGLAHVGSEARGAIPRLVRLSLETEDHQFAWMIWRLKPDAAALKPALVALERSGDETQRRALWLLSEVRREGGPVPAGAVERCRIALASSAEPVRIQASCFAAVLGDEAKPLVPALLKNLTHEAAATREAAAAAFVGLGPLGASARAALQRATEDSAEGVRAAALRGLGAQGASARASLAAIQARLEDGDAHVVAAALVALAQVAGPTPEVLSVLRARHGDDDYSVFEGSIDALAAWGPRGAPFLADLLTDPQTRYWSEVLKRFLACKPPPELRARVRRELELASLKERSEKLDEGEE